MSQRLQEQLQLTSCEAARSMQGGKARMSTGGTSEDENNPNHRTTAKAASKKGTGSLGLEGLGGSTVELAQQLS